jgi:hypothetical protein
VELIETDTMSDISLDGVCRQWCGQKPTMTLNIPGKTTWWEACSPFLQRLVNHSPQVFMHL